MALPLLPPNGSDLGFSEPTPEFVRITTAGDGDGRATVEGVAAFPGLPTCRVRLKTDVERVAQDGPGRAALVGYVHAALCEDVVVELPWN